LQDIVVKNIKYYHARNQSDDDTLRSNRVKVELDLSTEAWDRIKPELLYPHAITHNRRSTDAESEAA